MYDMHKEVFVTLHVTLRVTLRVTLHVTYTVTLHFFQCEKMMVIN